MIINVTFKKIWKKWDGKVTNIFFSKIITNYTVW